jgi:hypothetical protein
MTFTTYIPPYIHGVLESVIMVPRFPSSEDQKEEMVRSLKCIIGLFPGLLRAPGGLGESGKPEEMVICMW